MSEPITGRCQYEKQDGSPCRARPMENSSACFFHDPGLAGRRAEAQRTGGSRNKTTVLSCETPDHPLKTVANVAELLAGAINQVRRGELDPRVGNTLGYLASALLKALETGTLETRLSALEAAMKDHRREECLFDNQEFEFQDQEGDQ
jgi:hypothetical protein